MDADLAKPLGKRSLVPAQVVCVGVFRGQSGRKFAGGRGRWQKKPFGRCLVYSHRSTDIGTAVAMSRLCSRW